MAELSVEDQKLVLRRYAAGAELRTISEDMKVKHELVVEIVSDLGFSRQRASQRLRDIDARTPPRVVFEPSPPEPPKVTVEREPSLEPKAAEPNAQPKPTKAPARKPSDELLKAAEDAGGSFATRAGRIRANLAALAEDLAAYAAAAEALKRLEDAKAAVRKAEEEVRQLTGKAKPKRKTAEVDMKAVRAWARDNGFTVKDAGVVPTAVVDAWRAATGG